MPPIWRPVLCSIWNAPDAKAVKETLELFSRNHVFWYDSDKIADKSVLDLSDCPR